MRRESLVHTGYNVQCESTALRRNREVWQIGNVDVGVNVDKKESHLMGFFYTTKFLFFFCLRVCFTFLSVLFSKKIEKQWQNFIQNKTKIQAVFGEDCTQQGEILRLHSRPRPRF